LIELAGDSLELTVDRVNWW